MKEKTYEGEHRKREAAKSTVWHVREKKKESSGKLINTTCPGRPKSETNLYRHSISVLGELLKKELEGDGLASCLSCGKPARLRRTEGPRERRSVTWWHGGRTDVVGRRTGEVL